ncbi:MAG: ATP synthase F1 subunit epsilon [Candidatus Azosocius agrarius]|nr:MAG: ATP synthase F1 subunit epsilon [Gammaproteobacteria bacterium]
MIKCFQLNIVTAEKNIFSGLAQKLFVPGHLGELEILFNHAPLLTSLLPGPVLFINDFGVKDGIVIYGGMLEVQPKITTILANSALRSIHLDEEAALEAKKNCEADIIKSINKIDYNKARMELEIAIAQLRLIRQLRQK